MRRGIKIIFLVILSFFIILPALAQDSRSYFYQNIDTKIEVNTDTTFDVAESQIFNYTGEYHQGWRSIPLNKIDNITEVSVIDGATGQPLKYSWTSLDKTKPGSWGRYTYYRKNGAINIEWYYNMKDTVHTWILNYKIHGGLEFNKDADRLYWNIFTDYEVPVKKAGVEVFLPKQFNVEEIKINSYRSTSSSLENSYSALGGFNFSGESFSPYEDYTVDASWPAGIINRGAYWTDFLKQKYGIIGSILVVLLAFLYGLFFWLKNEKLKIGRGTIIPQYEPPKNLPPAEVEVLIRERVTNKGLVATLIDLAVRGYIKIEEESKTGIFKKMLGQNQNKKINLKLIWIFILYILVNIIGMIVMGAIYMVSDFLTFIIPFGILIIIFILIRFLIISGLGKKDYKVSLVKDFHSDNNLKVYEKGYLSSLLRGQKYFSTSEMRLASDSQKTALYRKIQEVKKNLHEALGKENIYEVDPKQEKWKNSIWVFLAAVIFGLAGTILRFNFQVFYLIAAVIISAAALWAYIRFETRLNKQGIILKEEWLGFKMYLETAERYRMQNLTPETFEKYLPYAMVFGIEKKWAAAFEKMNLPAPDWYAGTVVSAGVFSGSATSVATSFSPSAFSASFASSFSGAFSSAGGSGGGGGGGAGGGGGGGGGGAS